MTAAPMRHDARVLQTSVRVTQGRGLTAPARFVELEASVSQRTGDALCEEGTPLAHARLVHVAAVAQVPAPASGNLVPPGERRGSACAHWADMQRCDPRGLGGLGGGGVGLGLQLLDPRQKVVCLRECIILDRISGPPFLLLPW